MKTYQQSKLGEISVVSAALVRRVSGIGKVTYQSKNSDVAPRRRCARQRA
jgi:hypothetical protein